MWSRRIKKTVDWKALRRRLMVWMWFTRYRPVIMWQQTYDEALWKANLRGRSEMWEGDRVQFVRDKEALDRVIHSLHQLAYRIKVSEDKDDFGTVYTLNVQFLRSFVHDTFPYGTPAEQLDWIAESLGREVVQEIKRKVREDWDRKEGQLASVNAGQVRGKTRLEKLVKDQEKMSH